jgi:serine/threonine protein kinase
MPPEQAGEDRTTVGPYSDVYSLGAILFTMLAGRPPFVADTPMRTIVKVRSAEPAPSLKRFRPDAPDALESICHKCLRKNPDERFATARELADELRRLPTVSGAKVYLHDQLTGEQLQLRKPCTVLGRTSNCDIQVSAPEVSRRHCQILVQAENVLLEDLGSTQGTRINGRRIERCVLHDGDVLDVGKHGYIVRLS